MSGPGAGGFFSVAGAVAWRQLHGFFTRPTLLLPALAFPLFFLAAFAGGLSRVSDVPGFDFPAGYTAFQFVWILLQTVAVGGAFTGFAIAADFESGFAKRFLLAASRRSGIILGYVLVSAVRVTVTGSVATAASLFAGMRILGNGMDLFGLVGLAILVNIAATLFAAGIALMLRTSQGGFVIQTPIFLALFLAPVFVPLELLEGWIGAVASVNPVTFVLEAGRSLISGEPSGVWLAFGIGAATVLLFVPWALLGLRRAERSG
ncbi:MAG: ABC transporter permease [Rubrobacter sp.]|nr:ABC transporter permease [Rubrobacter sp.]